MAILQISNIFAKSANELPKNVRAKLPKVLLFLTEDLQHPSLNFEKLKGAVRPDVYECWIDEYWRIILKKTGKMIFLVYAGKHDKAIRYGTQLAEEQVSYGGDKEASITESLESYLAGDDNALEFVSVTQDELKRLLL